MRPPLPPTSPDAGPLPLAGIRVVVTRAEHQAEGLAEAFRRAGARVELLPLLALAPPRDPLSLRRAAEEVQRFDWLVFTSSNAVAAFFEQLPLPLPSSVKIAAVGRATRRAVEEAGAAVALQAQRQDGEGLAQALAEAAGGRLDGCEVLVPQAADARPALVEGLTQAGAQVTAVVAYDKALPQEARSRAAELFATEPLGWVTFTSPRIARHFAELLGEEWERRRGELRGLSIGAVTSRELRRLGVEPAAEAASPSDAEMVSALLRALAAPPSTP